MSLAQWNHRFYLDSLVERKKDSQKEWDELESLHKWKNLYRMDCLTELLHSAGIRIIPLKGVTQKDKEEESALFEWKGSSPPI